MQKSQRISQHGTKYIRTHTGQHKTTKEMSNTDPTKTGCTHEGEAFL